MPSRRQAARHARASSAEVGSLGCESGFFRIDVLLGLLVLALTVVRFVLAYALPLFTDLGLPYDDGLFYDYALSITEGEWVSPSYSVAATVKAPGYALFLVLCHELGARPQLVVVILQAVAAACAAQAIAPLVPSRRVRALAYLFLTYAPILLTREFGQRLYRNCLAVPLVLSLFSSYVALYLRIDKDTRTLLPWMAVAALSLGAFSIVNESASWVLPFVAASSVIMVVLRLKKWCRGHRGAHPVIVLLVLASPLLAMLGARQYVRSHNLSHYGVSVVSDKYEGEFGRVATDIVHIDGGIDDQRIWVSRDAIESALAASPTLNGIKAQLSSEWDVWTNVAPLEINGMIEMAGDMPFWCLMEAYEDAGGYRDGPSTQAFWCQVADELEVAFRAGTLKRRGGIYYSGTIRPVPVNSVGSWIGGSLAIVSAYPWDCGNLLLRKLVWKSDRLRAGNGSLEKQVEARDYLGGNTILGIDGETVDDACSQQAAPWLDVMHYLGVALVWLSRTLLLCSLLGIVCMLVRDVRCRDRRGRQCGLIVAGCLLSALVLTLGVSWMISFDSDLTVASIGDRAFCYLGPVYILWNFVEVLIVGRVCSVLCDARPCLLLH